MIRRGMISVLLCISLLISLTNLEKSFSSSDLLKSQSQEKTDNFIPLQCTEEVLKSVKSHLPEDICTKHAVHPYVNKCSFSYATRCPKATWIEDHFRENIGKLQASSFLGISVGCNKGVDAINTMRMGTFDPIFDKNSWHKARNDENIDNRCGVRNDNRQFDLEPTIRSRPGEMHCIEALPPNYEKLSKTVELLGLKEKGFHVSNAAIALTDGRAYFPTGAGEKEGIENLGFQQCIRDHTNCAEIPTFRLDSYVDRFVKSSEPINHLNIDIEGFDVDALWSASAVLNRTEYLEFEYNWMGSWAENKLNNMIEMLDERGFTCFWIGDDELWRITGCWLEHYNLHFWSNVGCAHRSFAKDIHRRMEKLFSDTLSRDVGSLNYVNVRYDRHVDNMYMQSLKKSGQSNLPK